MAPGKRSVLCFLLLLVILLQTVSAASAYTFESSCPQSFRLETVDAYGNPALSAFPSETENPENVCTSLTLDNLLPVHGDWTYVTFSGELVSPVPISSFALFLWDERDLSLEQFYYVPLSEPSSVVGTDALNTLLPVNRIRAGRKTIVIQGVTEDGPVVLARFLLIMRGNGREPAHITDRCGLNVWQLLDFDVKTVWTADERTPSLTFSIPEDAGASLLTLEWLTPPDSFTVVLSDRDGQVLLNETRATGFYLDSVNLPAGVVSVTVTPAGERCSLCSVRVYPETYAAFAVQQWEPLPDKVDLMLFSAHQDDELLFFGGMIPYYSDIGKTVAVTYLTNCSRARYSEALDGLWTTGLKYHPVFVGWTDQLVEDHATAEFIWNRDAGDPMLVLVRLIRQYRPDVIATHDFHGEYGHMQHILTAELVTQAAVLAGDPAYDPEGSVPWEVKKAYVHLYESGQIQLDWDQPLEEDSIFTPILLATEAFDKHRSQQGYFRMDRQGVLYDNSLFGLYYSTVGEDEAKNDLFEHIP